jgi:hypothetical protein
MRPPAQPTHFVAEMELLRKYICECQCIYDAWFSREHASDAMPERLHSPPSHSPPTHATYGTHATLPLPEVVYRQPGTVACAGAGAGDDTDADADAADRGVSNPTPPTDPSERDASHRRAEAALSEETSSADEWYIL